MVLYLNFVIPILHICWSVAVRSSSLASVRSASNSRLGMAADRRIELAVPLEIKLLPV